MNCKKGFATAFRWIATGIKIAAALAVLAVAGLGGGCVILLMVAMVVGVAMHAWTYFSDVAKAVLCTAVALGTLYWLFCEGTPRAWNYLAGLCRGKGTDCGK